MTTWDTPLQKTESFQSPPDWFEALVPVSATPLILLLLLILPIFLLAAESLFAPVYDFVHSLLIPVNAGMSYTGLPLQLIIKIILFSIFTFSGVMLLLLKVSCLYHEVWSYFFQQPHPAHTTYHPDQQESMIALFNWNVFRWFKVFGPTLGWTGLTILAGAVGLWIFTSFTDFGFFTFQLQFSLGFFMMSVLFFFTGIALLKGVFAALTTILGDVAAITEPEKPTQVLFERARKLALASPWSLVLYPAYLLFYVGLILEIVLLIARYDIQDFLTFNPDILPVFGLEIITFILFMLLNAMKFMVYHDALSRYYQRYSR